MVRHGTAILPRLFDGLLVVEQELLLFAAFWFVLAACDELIVDGLWAWLWATRRIGDARLPPGMETRPLAGRVAVMVPAWHEDRVLGHMIAHTLAVWPQEWLTLYIGCYPNDRATIEVAMAAACHDARLRLVINDKPGPTTKADCLNAIYAALERDEARSGEPFAGIVLHDAEDMVHPAALAVMDRALAEVDFVQLPVRPEPRGGWIDAVGGHYTDEFTESHAKAMVVRDALGTAIPAAGVGCGFARAALAQLAALRVADGHDGPFAAECLTEDYELGVLIYRGGGKSRFLRFRDGHGELVATRAYFPSRMNLAIRQKARWIHGIALQGWDRLGWSGRGLDMWMTLRDRQGPMTAAVLAAGYLLFVFELVFGAARLAGWAPHLALSPALTTLLWISSATVTWRATWRFAFTAREYGLVEGFRAVLRIPVANFITIMAGRRALATYVGTLRGAVIRWDKTAHDAHPAMKAATVEPDGR